MFESNLAPLLNFATRWWDDHGTTLIFTSLIAAVGFLAVSLLIARKHGHLPRWMSRVGNGVVLVLSAEGMWEFFTGLLQLPTMIALGGFAFGEFLLLSSMMHARAYYNATTIREHGKVVKWGHTGRHGRAVWIVATVIGVIVATGADHWQEIPFRLVLPLGAALMWYTELTAASEKRRSRWRWTPTRILIAVGALEPIEDDLDESDVVKRQRIRRMTKVACKIDAMDRKRHERQGSKQPLTEAERSRLNRWELRLQRLARDADDDQIAEVAVNVARVRQVRNDIDPDGKDRHARQIATLQAEHALQLDEVQAAAAAEHERLTGQLQQWQKSTDEETRRLRQDLEQAQARLSDAAGQRQDLTRQLEAANQQVTKLGGSWQAAQDEARNLRRDLETVRAAARPVSGPPATGPQWQTVPPGSASAPQPRAAVDGNTARTLDPVTVSASAPERTVKEQVTDAWTAALATGNDTVTVTATTSALFEYVRALDIVTEDARATVQRYARDWRDEVAALPEHRRASLRLVDADK